MKSKSTAKLHPVFTVRQKKALRKFQDTLGMTPEQKAQELFRLWQRTQRFKKVYERMDALVAQQDFGNLPSVEHKGVVYELNIKDNFAEKNVVYRPAGVRRKELEVKPRKGEK